MQRVLFGLSAFLVVCTASVSLAQQQANTPTAVIIASSTHLPIGEAVMITRRAKSEPRYLIEVDLARVAASDLQSAMNILANMNRRRDATYPFDIQAFVKRYKMSPEWAATGQPVMDRYLNLLRASSSTNVAGLGLTQAISVPLSSNRGG